MTLHKSILERHSQDELSALIRWTLRDRVAGASPSPEVWERIRTRICARAEQSTVQGPALPPRGLHCEGTLVAGVAVSRVEGRVGSVRGGYRAAIIQLSQRLLWGLSRANEFLSAQTVGVRHQSEWKEWRLDPDYAHTRLLVDQCGFQLLLAF